MRSDALFIQGSSNQPFLYSGFRVLLPVCSEAVLDGTIAGKFR